MTINPHVPDFMRPIPDPPVLNKCPAGEHDYPPAWDYSHDPAGSKECRRCHDTIHD